MHSQVLIVAVPGRLPRIEATGGAGRPLHATRHRAPGVDGGHPAGRRHAEGAGGRRDRRPAADPHGRGDARAAQRRNPALRGGLGHRGRGRAGSGPATDRGGGRFGASHANPVAARRFRAVRIREQIQIGRSNERAGFWSGLLHADAAGAPLLRHRIELGSGALGDDEIAAPRACISEMRYPEPTFDAPDQLVLGLARGGSLATWQGDRLPAD